MSHRFIASIGAVAVAIAVASLAPARAAGQDQSTAKTTAGAKAAKPWTPPRTPAGQPDLQGIWDYRTITPLERPKELGTKAFFTAEEAAAWSLTTSFGTTGATRSRGPGARR
jgi:hypothetical protein